MVYITGDTHAEFSRFSSDNFPEQKEMTRNDYVIICGDFGGIWGQDESKTEKYWLNWIENKPFTTLFIDGNHENFERLYEYPVKTWHGGKVHEIRPHILHLMRGQVFNIENKTFFTFGGASSHDISDGILEKDDPRIKRWRHDYNKFFRINHISWWKEELPTAEEMNEGLDNLKQYDFKVDYILTHTPYTSALPQLGIMHHTLKSDILTEYLQQIKEKTHYTRWFFGHMHVNTNLYHEKSIGLYEQTIRLL